MKSAELDLLERAFSAEIEGRGMIQTKSKAAVSLVEQGMLAPVRIEMGRPVVTIEGYELTHAGRYAYCTSKRCM